MKKIPSQHFAKRLGVTTEFEARNIIFLSRKSPDYQPPPSEKHTTLGARVNRGDVRPVPFGGRWRTPRGDARADKFPPPGRRDRSREISEESRPATAESGLFSSPAPLPSAGRGLPAGTDGDRDADGDVRLQGVTFLRHFFGVGVPLDVYITRRLSTLRFRQYPRKHSPSSNVHNPT